MHWFSLVKEDFQAVFARDPATQNAFSVLFLHTGFFAVVSYRLQHAVWSLGLHSFARAWALLSRWLTGVEIHPAVKIGRRFFVDHGMGIVIGETAELGDDVSIYQGVTLGGTSWQAGKRHPTIGNGVILGAGAKVIGAITVGDYARVGSNAVVVKNVEPHSTVVGVPAHVVRIRGEDSAVFRSYGVGSDVPDPILQRFDQLNARIEKLEAENEALKQQLLSQSPTRSRTMSIPFPPK